MNPLLSRTAAAALLIGLAVPASADVTHHVSGRFGVSYISDPGAGQSQMQPFYEGRYTASFGHETDTGVRFRFDLGIVLSNFESPRPERPFQGSERR